MPFKTEIKQFNTLTKRFQRDSAKIVNEIKVRVQEGGLTKMELQKLIESFGKIELFFSLWLNVQNLTCRGGRIDFLRQSTNWIDFSATWNR